MDESENPLQALFAEALEITDAAQQAAFLNRACGPDANLRREVEELLQAEAGAGKFLPDQPAATASRSPLHELQEATGPSDPLPSSAPTEEPGDRIGRYELVEKIGEGGCGVVYLARQETPVRRQVALKVIKLGMDTRHVIARFEAERQALAMMDHSHIARVLDAGATDSGRPYFVMELVHGSKITDYCTQHHLSIRERLDLFIQVCQAVQHAHQKGVIHRDLKPSNILVTVKDGVPVPKVIDFGIAKATEGKLTDETLFTAFEQFLGTPAYMSPEQAAMTSVDIDTRSDIYSLGVLLYELLTGTTPFDTRSLLALGVDELRRTIREKSPVRPSTVLRRRADSKVEKAEQRGAKNALALNSQLKSLSTDLDWIVMKCLEKDRGRRYETANGLAADLRRHLNNEPVLARPPSRLYEFQKTLRRHKVGFAATAVAIVVLLAGVIASTWEAVRAMRAESEQTRLRQQAEAESYTSDMNLCYQDWTEGYLSRARERLNAHIPQPGQSDLRGFEWRYLWNLCQDERLHTVEFPNDDQVWRLAATPAHSFVAAACEKTIRLLEPSTGRELTHFSYPNPVAENTCPALALAAGMTNLLAAHRAEGVVGLWDLASRRLLMTFRPFTNTVSALALSPDGHFLAAVDRQQYYGTELTLWDISSRPQPPRLVRSYSFEFEEGMPALAFSSDGKVLVTAQSLIPEVVLDTWEVTTGRKLNRISNASAGNINAIAFSPDGMLLAASGVEGRINVWDSANRTLKFHFDGHSAVTSLAFSADGAQLISGGGEGTIRRWDIPSQKAAGLWRLPQGGDLAVVFAPDGKSIVSGARDGVGIWEPEPREPAKIVKVQQGWGWPTVSPDSKSLIVSGHGSADSVGATVWDIASGQHKFDLVYEDIGAQTPVFSPDGRYFALGGFGKKGLVGLWEPANWRKGAARVKPFRYLTNFFEAASVCFSPDRKILAVAGQCFRPFEPKEPSGATNRLAFWEVGSWKKLNLLPQAGVGTNEWAAANTVAFSPDGRLLAVGSRNGCVRLWDFKEQRLLKESKEFGGDNPSGVAVGFSSDSRWLASINLDWASVDLWDMADPEHPRSVWLGPKDIVGIHWALFAPDNKSLITAHNDGLIKFWNLQTQRVALTLQHGHGPGGALAMSPDGNFLVSNDPHGIVKLWTSPSLKEIDRGLQAR
jgi:eukaryotic-like serine/threonine-protein kinase